MLNDRHRAGLRAHEGLYEVLEAERAMQESDLLAFQIGLRIAAPGAVMCAYNRLNGAYSCENPALLRKTLKQQWGFKGFVLSDWSATHST